MNKLYTFFKCCRRALPVLLFAASASVHAQTITIYRGGTPLATTYTTLASAVAASVNDDVLELSADTFVAHNLLINKRITIQGIFDVTDSTLIYGQDQSNSRVLNISANVTLSDVIVSGGNADGASMSLKITTGGGIMKTGSDTLTLRGGTTIRHNRSLDDGGGIYVASGAKLVTMDNTVISDNIAKNGAGIAFVGGGTIGGQTIIARNFVLTNGGGIYCTGSPVLITENALIQDNSAMHGGGIYTNANLRLSKKARVTGNTAINEGGGIGSYLTAVNRSIHIDRGVEIDHNTASLASAIYNTHDSLMITGANIHDNDVTGGASIVNERVVPVSTPPGYINIDASRVYNPMPSGGHGPEIFVNTGVNHYFFHTTATWWGISDTTGIASVATGNASIIESWVIANWAVNDSLAITGLSSFPVSARLTLQDHSPLPTKSFLMLNGKFASVAGNFSDTLIAMDSTNKVLTTYHAPTALSSETISCSIDADHYLAHFTVGTTSIPYVSGLAGIRVYPNPADRELFLDGTKNGQQLTIFGMNGQVAMRQRLEDGRSEISLEALSAGNYVLQLSDEHGWIGAVKLVKH